MALYADSRMDSTPSRRRSASASLLDEYKLRFLRGAGDVRLVRGDQAGGRGALNLPIALGEQEYSLHGFRWLIANDAVQHCATRQLLLRRHDSLDASRPNGRRIRDPVARRTCLGGGLGFLYMMHLVSAIPNATPHHEFKGLTHKRCEVRTARPRRLRWSTARSRCPPGRAWAWSSIPPSSKNISRSRSDRAFRNRLRMAATPSVHVVRSLSSEGKITISNQ